MFGCPWNNGDAVVAWGGTVAHADEVTTSVDTTIQRTENPATTTKPPNQYPKLTLKKR
nr:hypothetical protein [Streptococcus ruminantium]